jgi:hypothetical protein
MISSGLASKPDAMVSSGLTSKPPATVSGGLTSKPVATVFSGLASKSTVMVSSGLASKPAATVSSGLASKPDATVSGGLASKPAATVFSGLASKPVATVFSSLALKLVVTVSSGFASKSVVGFLVEPQNQGGGTFSCLDLKTSSFGLVFWASKSSRRFLGLVPKIKWASVCRLRHKTDGGRSARDTCRDLAACFAWKQVWPKVWRRRDDGWCTWHHSGGYVGGKLKMDGLMRRTASDPSTLPLSFSMY